MLYIISCNLFMTSSLYLNLLHLFDPSPHTLLFWQPWVCSRCLSLFLCCYLCSFVFKWRYTISFSVWLISPGPFMLSYVARFHFFMAKFFPLCIYICSLYIHRFFVHSSVYGCLDCFHTLAIVNNASVNFEVVCIFSN